MESFYCQQGSKIFPGKTMKRYGVGPDRNSGGHGALGNFTCSRAFGKERRGENKKKTKRKKGNVRYPRIRRTSETNKVISPRL